MEQLSIQLYRKMYLIRYAEEYIRQFYHEDEMKTPMHMSMGGEAIAAGVCHALHEMDQVFTSYRSHAVYLAKSQNTKGFFAEMYGKDAAMAKGKAGSMHLSEPSKGVMGASAVLATQIPVAVGAAFSAQYKKRGNTVAVFFGDGAIDEGVFWESLNAACAMRVPMLFICEDNGFSVHTPPNVRHGYQSISDVVTQFNCHVFSDASNEVEQIYRLTQQAISDSREQSKPSFIHCKYCRYLEHVGVKEDFHLSYRSNEDYEEWKKNDPILLQRAKLVAELGEAEVVKIESTVHFEVMQAVEIAKNSPFPDKKHLYTDVFAGKEEVMELREEILL